jgi:hypothetical protein
MIAPERQIASIAGKTESTNFPDGHERGRKVPEKMVHIAMWVVQ